MTSPKKQKVEREGFIHQATAVTQGTSRKRFPDVLQEATKNTELVIFAPETHNWFMSAEKDQCLVKLQDILLTPSPPGQLYISVDERSQLKCVPNCYDELSHKEPQNRSLGDILADPREYRRVNVLVKIGERLEVTSETRTYNPIIRTLYDVSDETASVALSVWGNDTLLMDNWYHFRNVSVQSFFGEVLLKMTPETTFDIAEDAGAASPLVNNETTRKVGDILQANVTISYLCHRGKTKYQCTPSTTDAPCAYSDNSRPGRGC
ncbi:hypothetical protein DPEC_G00008950 [Dallia pectoralis]|uniref:Uncharacterized protein n=1 Tax=Dallia pectoralis TaxID=75939 RepID=A0ACC2HKR5_DALPE|nr:hypothetical protein DPEC_G00008950 [Dallia pectoralis]